MILSYALPPLFPSGGFHPLYKAILRRSVALGAGYGAPSLTWQIRGNNYLISLLQSGAWYKLDALWNLYHDGESGFGMIDWKNPSRPPAAPSGVVTFTPLSGYTSPGGASGPYIDTFWSESVDGVNWQALDCGFFAGIGDNGQELAYFCGAQDGTAPISRLRPRTALNEAGLRIDSNNNEIVVSGVTDASGLWVVSRNVNNVQTYRNGVQVSTVTNTANGSRAISTHNILRANVSGGTPSTRIGQLYGVGSALIGYEAHLNNSWVAYKTP